MLRTSLKTAMIAGLLAGTATGAQAAEVLFELSGAQTASFTLDESPTPDEVGAIYFEIRDFDLTLNGVNDQGKIRFYPSTFDGGLLLEPYSLQLVSVLGDQLYTGSLASPTFKTGTFAMTDFFTGAAYTLNISSVGGAVPEPGTWALMILGFGFVGGAMRARRGRQKLSVSYS